MAGLTTPARGTERAPAPRAPHEPRFRPQRGFPAAAWACRLGPTDAILHLRAPLSVRVGLQRRLRPSARPPHGALEVSVAAIDGGFYRDDDRTASARAGTFVERHDFRLHRTPRGWSARTLARAESAEMALRWIAGIALLERGGLPLHGASAVFAGRAHLFLGPSGAGKTTLARESSADALLCDELSLIAPGPSGWQAHPSPFWGLDEPAGTLAAALSAAPLAAVWLLDGWSRTSARPLDPTAALLGVFGRVIDLGADPRAGRLAFEAVSSLLEQVPVGRLSWRRGDALGPVLDGALAGRAASAPGGSP